ncbi:unnamed protein product [Adineta steineri]|uniref:Uncharacterized protein n=1 Tax=Adineta steineri TaxID=433720 RepID=A0A813WPZ2_9BILA|nr:unnamed protein product [Adineta steineri]CAF0823991.1 unnamed protein product [Adineta steineri]CAF0864519.1 unnamed protein product [Adineta steineri]
MPHRQITSRDVASIPQPGFNLAESINFSPDDNLLTYLRSPNHSLMRQLYAYDLRTDREFLYAKQQIEDQTMDDQFSIEEQLQRERQCELMTGITRYQLTKNKTQSIMLIPIGTDLYIHDKKELRLLVNGSHRSPILDPKLSPDGTFVAYVQDNELYCVSTASSNPPTQPRRLTFDARHYPNKSNGLAEFIAQEEMDRNDGFWWSDDSRFIAFTQVDESNVPIFRISHSGSDDPDHVEEHRYPFTGKANVQVTVGVIDLNSEDNKKQPNIHWVDLSSFNDYYIARVHFFPDHTLALQIENRQQTRLQLYQYDFLKTDKLKLLIEDTSQSWINLHDLFYTLKKTPTQFIWASEQTGYMHLQLHDYNTGKLIKTLTSGNWVVQRIVDIDETNSIIYFLANRETPLEIHLYSVNYNDEIPIVDRITQESGCHVVHCFNQTYQYCITQWNSIDQYPLLRMIDVRTKEVIKNFIHLQQGQLYTLEQFQFVKPKLFSILNRNNDTLYCALYKPNDEQERYKTPFPTIVSVYGGPCLQRVVNSWSLRSDMRCQRLVQSGYVVLRLDNRGTPNRGVAFESAIKHDMGHLELDDQIDGVRYLVKQGITDETRVGIYGWSYGGYMSAMALVRASNIFKLGIAGAPVTHWDGYDTHYTERYMGTPEENPHGYEISSIMYHINNLKGHLMIIHGLIDENVHFRHTARLVNALIKANKSYELLLLPDERHMPRKFEERIYMEDRIFEYIRKYL